MSERYTTQPNDYFAARLLTTVAKDNPYEAAWVAQDESRKVGFDFSNVNDVLDRALDEVRETREAHGDWSRSKSRTDKAHLGDEIADLVFSTVNIVRHRGIGRSQVGSLAPRKSNKEPIELETALGRVTEGMKNTAKGPKGNVISQATGIIAVCDQLAVGYGFDLSKLTTENVRKYLDRCNAIETLADRDGKTWADLASNKEIIKYWKKAKEIL